MNARPVQLVKADLAPTEAGGATLKVKIKPTGASRWLFRVPEGATKAFELDALGLFVWESCDGRTTVAQIVKKLAKQHRLNLREAEVPTLQFLRTLTKKGLIGMEVKRSEPD